MKNTIKISDTGFAPVLFASTPVVVPFQVSTSDPNSLFDAIKNGVLILEEDVDNLFGLDHLIQETVIPQEEKK